jgi:hypothetical protein
MFVLLNQFGKISSSILILGTDDVLRRPAAKSRNEKSQNRNKVIVGIDKGNILMFLSGAEYICSTFENKGPTSYIERNCNNILHTQMMGKIIYKRFPFCWHNDCLCMVLKISLNGISIKFIYYSI